MSAELVFKMGEYSATFPTDRMYAKNHMWAQQQSTGALRFGLTGYAVRLLQDVYFLDLVIEPGMVLSARQEIGSIESKKAESSLYSPMAGTVAALNAALVQDPTGINLDKYGAGWMFELKTDTASNAQLPLLEAPRYMEHLTAAWEVAQRTIKGQANA